VRSGAVKLFGDGAGTAVKVGETARAGDVAVKGAPSSQDQIGGGLDVVVGVGRCGHANKDIRAIQEDARDCGGWQRCRCHPS
jgi:hypothetical protein